MGLNAVLVDRARRVAPTASGVKVEGTTQFTEIPGPWFRARISILGGAQTEASARVRAGLSDDGGSRAKGTHRYSLMFGMRDENGDSLLADGQSVVLATDRLELESVQLGSLTVEVTETPTPIRKKRRVIGFEVALARVDEFEFVERLG